MPALSAFAWLPWLLAAELTQAAEVAGAAAAPAPAALGQLDASLIVTGIGPWGASAHAEAGAEATDSLSAGLAYSALAYLNMGRLTARYRHLYRIGGGSAGFDGAADIDVQVGRLWALGAGHALVARAGARGYLYGNHRLFASLLELPAAETGYQLLSATWHLELLAQGGLSLLGAHRAHDAAADALGGALTYGGRVALGWRALNAEVGWAALGEDARRLELTSCAIVGKLGLCAELARLSSGARRAATEGDGEQTSQTITLWLSVGASERK